MNIDADEMSTDLIRFYFVINLQVFRRNAEICPTVFIVLRRKTVGAFLDTVM